MNETFDTLIHLLTDQVLPNLKSVEASQIEQRAQTDRLNRNLEEFRLEMNQRLTAIHAEIALCRQELEDLTVTICESESLRENPAPPIPGRRVVH